MNILFIRANQGIPDSRVEKEIFSLSKSHTVHLLGWDRTKTEKDIIKKRVQIFGKEFDFFHICIDAPQGEGWKRIFIPMVLFWYRVYRFLIQNMELYDAIHVCDFDTAVPLFFLRRKKKIVVYDIFDYYADAHNMPTSIRLIVKRMENKFINQANAVILCTEKRIEQIYPAKAKKIEIIHNTPIYDSQRQGKLILRAKTNEDKLKVAYVGVLSSERFLKEMASVFIKNPNIEWHVAGFGELAGFFANLDETSENIYFYGKIGYLDALKLEEQCDIMTAIYDPRVPNHKYAAPNKFYESLMLCKPLIASRNTGLDKYFDDYNIGIQVDCSSFIESFEYALLHIIKMDFMHVAQVEMQLYNECFSWDKMEKRLLGLYDSLGNEK